MEVFSAVRLGVKPEINAVASLILLAVSIFTLIGWFIARSAEKRRATPPDDEETITWQAVIDSRRN